MRTHDAKRKAFVTGGTGLIGRHVLRALSARGFDVHASTRQAKATNCVANVTWHRCDLFSVDEVRRVLTSEKPDLIVHGAWATEHGSYWTSPQNLDWAKSTLTLIRVAHDVGVERFVGIGTCAEYAWGGTDPLHEARSSVAPSTLYGVSKDATRRLCEAFSQQVGMSFAWTRLFLLYGAGEQPNRLVSSLARALIRGDPALMSSGVALRDLMDARDVGAAIAAVSDSALAGCVNIGNGVGIRLRDVGEALARLAGRPDLLRLGAIPDRPGDPAVLVANVERLNQETDFRVSIPIEQGLRDALEFWREELNRK